MRSASNPFWKGSNRRNLKASPVKLWKHRYIFFKAEENLSAKEKEIMQEVLQAQPEVSFLRGFLLKVWAIFEDPTTEAQAQAKLAELKKYAAHHENDGYTKSCSFLDEHFKNMTTFWRVPGVQGNSLAKSGMRVLRRLERNHDGFRSERGRQNALKIYQAITYLGWSIHNPPNLAASPGQSDGAHRYFLQAMRIRRRLGLVTPMDLLVRAQEELQYRLDIGDRFMREIVERGKVMYEATHSSTAKIDAKQAVQDCRKVRAATRAAFGLPIWSHY